VLDHVERRRFLVEPARKGALPLPVRPLHVELHERAGQLLAFPRRTRLARLQANDRVPHPHRLPGSQAQVANDPIALVEEAQNGDALAHRRDSDLLRRGGTSAVLRGRGLRPGLLRLLLLLPLSAGGERKKRRRGARDKPHSGVQGS
jgi:hypothetical protein